VPDLPQSILVATVAIADKFGYLRALLFLLVVLVVLVVPDERHTNKVYRLARHYFPSDHAMSVCESSLKSGIYMEHHTARHKCRRRALVRPWCYVILQRFASRLNSISAVSISASAKREYMKLDLIHEGT
jgi:hypothetical protein